MKIYSKSDIQQMLENKEISFSDSLILDFQREKRESDLLKIEKGLTPLDTNGKVLHTIHIEKIVDLTLKAQRRMSEPDCVTFADRYNLSAATVSFSSSLVAKMVYPDKYDGKIRRNDRSWISPIIKDYLRELEVGFVTV